MAYNTGNPVGSSDFRDLSDNAVNFDKYSVGPDPAYPNRLGALKLSIEGMNQEFNNAQDGRTAEFQQFLADAAFVFIGNYAMGLTFTSRSQYMIRDSVPYRLSASATLPYTASGNWATEMTNFTPINSDDILRQDLAAGGSNLVNPTVVGATSGDASVVPINLKQLLDNRNVYPFQFKLSSDPDDTLSWDRAAATGKLVDGLGKTYTVVNHQVPNNRMYIRANFVAPNSATDNTSVLVWNGVSADKLNFSGMDLRINGNREGQTNIGFGATGDGTRHGFFVNGGIQNFTLTNCSAINCGTDGLALFGASASRTFAIKNVVLNNCNFQGNRRHGVSIDTAKTGRVYGGLWTNNGNDLPGASGQPITSGWYGARVGSTSGPQYGNACDMETYGADSTYGTHVEDWEFHGVTMTGNFSGGFKLLTVPGSNISSPNWKPCKSIKFFGGTYDAGLATPSAETSPFQIGATGSLPRTTIGVEDLFIYGSRCSSSIALNNVNRASITCQIDSLNGGSFPYHAFVQDSLNIDLDILTPQTLAVYQDGSTVTVNKKLTGVAVTGAVAPTVTVSGGTIASQTTTLISSSLQAGQVYRINVTATLTLAVGSNLQLALAGGRAILDAQGSFFNTTTSIIGSAFYRASGGYFLLRPDTQNSLEIVLYVTVT